MSMIVARMQKMKADNLIGIGNHNQRKTKNHSNNEIDIDLSYLNYDLVNQTESYKKDIENFINENKSSTRAVRKDAVLINEWIVTSDKTFFENLSIGETKEFFSVTKDYFAENYGEENIRYATVHLDETTPHMHMGIVPFDDDKKLSAKRVFNRAALQEIQEELPIYLQEKGFEIERGSKGSERKNLTVPEFKKLKEEEKEIERKIEKSKIELLAYTKENKIDENLDITPKKEMEEKEIKTDEKSIFGVTKTKTVKRWTGNIILSEKDYLKLNQEIKKGKKAEGRLEAVLETDFYKENQNLKMKNKELNSLEIDYIDLSQSLMYQNKLNDELKDQIGDLKTEIKFIYNSTKEFLKELTEDLSSFKSVLSGLVDDVTYKLSEKGLNSQFKKEFDKEKKLENRNKKIRQPRR